MIDPNRTQLGAPPTVDPNRTLMGTAPTINATQTIKPVQCPICKQFNPPGMMFCVECGLIFDRSLPEDAFGAPVVRLPVLVDTGGREHPLRPGPNVIGRQGDVAIEDGRVSRKHAQIVSEGGAMTVEDLGSTNGTTVNGDQLGPGERRELRQGDKVSLGGVELQLSLPGEASKTEMPIGRQTQAIAAPPTVETARAYLDGEDQRFPLEAGENTFGRRSSNAVVIADPYVSGQHGVIEIAEDGVYLTDTGSTNGTLVNEAKLAANMRTKLGPDDVIRLGALTFRVVLAQESA